MSKSQSEKPDYLKELDELEASGALKKVEKMIRDKEEVWVKRSSGAWQKGRVFDMGHGGLSVVVEFDDPNMRPSRRKGNLFNAQKLVRTSEFLQWQEEGGKGGEVIQLAEQTSKKVKQVLAPPPLKASPAYLAKTAKEKNQETPMIRGEEYWKLYNSDSRVAGDETTATFNFQGMVNEDREKYEKGEFYKDAMATNGLLKAKGHEGVHVGTDGIISYRAFLSSMKSAEDVGEYDVYIKIPWQLQKEMGCVCYSDSCFSADDFESKLYGDIDQVQKSEDYIVIRLSLEPKEDKLARKKALIIHQTIVKWIQEKRPFHQIKDMVHALQNKLMDLNEDELEAWDVTKEVGPKRLAA